MSDGKGTPKRRAAPDAANGDAEAASAVEQVPGEPEADDAGAAAAAAEAGAPTEPVAASEPAPPTPEEEIAQLKDQLLRAMAETENVRRRSRRELEDMRKYAIADFARDLLTLADNLDRAIANAGAEQSSLLEGVQLTQRQFLQVLEKFGIRPVAAEGQKLDPNLHQAMMQVESGAVEGGTIVQVLQVGYTIHDRLLRPAMVAVAKAPEAAPEAAEAKTENGA